jgi:putative transposase
MPRPYSNDLRRKIVETVESGTSCRQTAGQFKVSVSFVIKLLQRVRATGDVSPAQFGGYTVSPLVAHEADLKRWVAERSEITIAELQTLLAERGTRTSPAALARFLGKLGLTRKKRRHGPPSSRATTSPRPARHGSAGSVD